MKEINCNSCARRNCPAIKDVDNFVKLNCPGRIKPLRTFRMYDVVNPDIAKKMFKLRKQLA
ncbi:MAG: hypothetical protein DRI61_12730 [Chloroflexi bacterium]|nr:MAG: hypothetical protein DRI61_12730 [Chloroflexota bacterium]